jgi:23S rRNA (adenine-N6)-dimethyltransferase
VRFRFTKNLEVDVNRQQQHRRKQFAQNFLTSERLVSKLVDIANLTTDDTVIDIGAGRGIITAEVARRAQRVIAIEKDPRLVRGLRERFRKSENVEIVADDFLTYRIPVREYKVFANIPYNLTAAIVRKLIEAPRRAPSEAYLIIQKEPARRFAGLPCETMFSVLAKPYFDLAIVHHLRRTDFHPVPDVDSVMLRISRQDQPLVDDAPRFGGFVEYGFTRYKSNLRLAYKNVFTYKQWKRLAHDLRFAINATPSELTFEQWLGLYDAYVRVGCAR